VGMFAGLLALSLLISQVPVVPLPCVPGDSTVVCKCKQASPTACAELAKVNAETLQGLLRAAAMVEGAKKAEQEKAKAADVVDAGGCGSGQDPNEKQECTGQWHHIISRLVWYALEEHPVLKGKYTYRDSRFVTQGKDPKAHCGWPDWHRDIDKEIAAWVRKSRDATPEEFEAYLREVYARPELRARFPNGF
jgi:hypothetical protein